MNAFSPIIAISNFVLIAYNFSIIKQHLPFETFAILFVVSSIIFFIFIGGLFRKNQYKIDNAIQYENNPELLKTMLAILETLPKNDRIIERVNFHRNLLKKKED